MRLPGRGVLLAAVRGVWRECALGLFCIRSAPLPWSGRSVGAAPSSVAGVHMRGRCLPPERAGLSDPTAAQRVGGPGSRLEATSARVSTSLPASTGAHADR